MRTRSRDKRGRRIDVRKPAILVNCDGIEVEVMLLDISSNGFRVEVDDQLHVGERVSLRVDGELVSAEIRWVLGKEAGGTFLTPVDFTSL